MQENTNKAILFNSIINYAKMGITTILALFTTRYALLALGVTDYGLFSVLGSFISFVGVFNSVMINTCNRFMAVAIGRGDENEINKTFCINLSIFVSCAILMLLLALPIGFWFIRTKLNYDGDLSNAYIVYLCSVVGSILSTLSTPYKGLLISRERFFVFSIVDIIQHILQFIIAFCLVYFFSNKLLIYTICMSVLTAIPLLAYRMYCKRLFPCAIKWRFVRDKNAYMEVFSFSGWVTYGAIACIAKTQGAGLIVNAFFNTIMNAALGIANSLGNYVTMFAGSIVTPIQPQITKSYASGNKERTNELLVMSTKFSFLLMLIIGTPFFVNAEWILEIWLKEVPPYTVLFTELMIIDNIVLSFNSGLSTVIFASGKIMLYQVLINTLRLCSIVVAYFVLKSGLPASYLLITYIVFSVIIVLCTQWCLHKTLNFDNSIFLHGSYIPSVNILIFMMPIFLLKLNIHPLFQILLSEIYLLTLIFIIGLSNREKEYVLKLINKKK